MIPPQPLSCRRKSTQTTTKVSPVHQSFTSTKASPSPKLHMQEEEVRLTSRSCSLSSWTSSSSPSASPTPSCCSWTSFRFSKSFSEAAELSHHYRCNTLLLLNTNYEDACRYLWLMDINEWHSNYGQGWIREAPDKDNACSTGILPNSVWPPLPPQANGRFVAGIFRRKLANSLKQRLWLREWIFWQ